MTDENRQQPKPAKPRRRVWRRLALAFGLCILVPTVTGAALNASTDRAWWQARRDSTGQAPDPKSTPEAVVQVYTGRAFSWRGTFGVHSWIAVKPSGADHYTRLEVVGWGVSRGAEAVRIHPGTPDGYWFGNWPDLLVDLRGPGVDRIIEKIVAAAATYPHNHLYRLWPGPNSNSFTAFIGRKVPELRLDLPPTAIGKDYLGDRIVDWTPSRTGFQASLFGVFGIALGLEEGIEINVLGLNFGLDVNDMALRLPTIGWIGPARKPTTTAEQAAINERQG